MDGQGREEEDDEGGGGDEMWSLDGGGALFPHLWVSLCYRSLPTPTVGVQSTLRRKVIEVIFFALPCSLITSSIASRNSTLEMSMLTPPIWRRPAAMITRAGHKIRVLLLQMQCRPPAGARNSTPLAHRVYSVHL